LKVNRLKIIFYCYQSNIIKYSKLTHLFAEDEIFARYDVGGGVRIRAVREAFISDKPQKRSFLSLSICGYRRP
jgi:hypothetical protein